MKNNVLFAYGTLKTGFYFNERYLGGGKGVSIGPAKTSKAFTLYIHALPNMVAEPGEYGVKGELFEVTEAALKEIDILEGHPEFYCRELINVTNKDGIEVSAWAYLRPKHFAGKTHSIIEEEFV